MVAHRLHKLMEKHPQRLICQTGKRNYGGLIIHFLPLSLLLARLNQFGLNAVQFHTPSISKVLSHAMKDNVITEAAI